MKIARVWMVPIVGALAIGATFMAIPGSADKNNHKDRSGSACASVEGAAKVHAQANGHAHANGQTKRLERLAGELGISVEELVRLQGDFDVSLKEIMTAHMIEEQATTAISLEQILTMRAEGTSWRQIAAEAGLNIRGQGRGQLEVEGQDCDSDVEGGARADAKGHGQARLQRLAAELGISAEELLQQQQTFGVSLKDLAIAHRIVARSTTDLSLEDVFAMRASGADWRQIAAAAGISAGEIKAVTKANGKASAKVKSSATFKVEKNVRRAAAEVGISAEEFLQQQQAFGVSTAELVLAHKIVANAATGLTVEDVFAMRAQGATWTQIMSSAGVGVGDLVKQKASSRTTAQSQATTRTNADAKARATAQTKAKGLVATVQNKFRARGTTRLQGSFESNDMNGSVTTVASKALVTRNGAVTRSTTVAAAANASSRVQTSSQVAAGAGTAAGIKSGQQASPMSAGTRTGIKARAEAALRAQASTNGIRTRVVMSELRANNAVRAGSGLRASTLTGVRQTSSVRVSDVTGGTRVIGVSGISGATRLSGATRISGLGGVSGGLGANVRLTGRLGLNR